MEGDEGGEDGEEGGGGKEGWMVKVKGEGRESAFVSSRLSKVKGEATRKGEILT